LKGELFSLVRAVFEANVGRAPVPILCSSKKQQSGVERLRDFTVAAAVRFVAKARQ
jgi:hypothetical protein